MTNSTLQSDHFSSLTTLFKNVRLLQTASRTYDSDAKVSHYIDLDTKEDVDHFLNHIFDWQDDLFLKITSLSKALFNCDLKELDDSDVKDLFCLLAALGEIGSYVTNATSEMTKTNTFPKNSQKA